MSSWVEGFYFTTYAFDATEAEIKTIVMALQWIKDKGWRNVTIATNY